MFQFLSLVVSLCWIVTDSIYQYDPDYELSLWEGSLFGVSYDQAKANARLSNTVYEIYTDSRREFFHTLDDQQKRDLDDMIEWQYLRCSCWNNLANALDPTNRIFTRRYHLSIVRDNIRVLGLGKFDPWLVKWMPDPLP